jgi:hypothetical protein
MYGSAGCWLLIAEDYRSLLVIIIQPVNLQNCLFCHSSNIPFRIYSGFIKTQYFSFLPPPGKSSLLIRIMVDVIDTRMWDSDVAQSYYDQISVMSSSAVKKLSFVLSTSAKNLVFAALSGKSKGGFLYLSASNILSLTFCFPSFSPMIMENHRTISCIYVIISNVSESKQCRQYQKQGQSYSA